MQDYLAVLIPSNLLYEALMGTVLFLYVIVVVFLTKYVYNAMVGKGLKHHVAVYYNRKLIHIFAGGVVALLVPFLFTSPLLPFILASALAIVTWWPHRTGKLMSWFQVRENMYEVNFCVMWGLSMLLAWVFLGDPLYALVPILFMAFGDAATGLVRNTMFKKRTKSWWGNLAMFAVTAPIAYILLGGWGVPLAAAASFIEHFEMNPIDDNVLISITAFLGVVLIKMFA
jgi:phytol kinase